MQEVTKNYDDVVKTLQAAQPNIIGIRIAISPNVDEGVIILTVDTRKIVITPEQALDLMNLIKSSILEVKPKILRTSHHGRKKK